MEAWLLGLCICHQSGQSGQGQERIEVVRVPNPLAPDASEAGNLSRIEGGDLEIGIGLRGNGNIIPIPPLNIVFVSEEGRRRGIR